MEAAREPSQQRSGRGWTPGKYVGCQNELPGRWERHVTLLGLQKKKKKKNVLVHLFLFRNFIIIYRHGQTPMYANLWAEVPFEILQLLTPYSVD